MPSTAVAEVHTASWLSTGVPVVAALVPILVAIVVAKFGSSPRAAANSFNVSSVVGAESTKALIWSLIAV